MPGLPIPNGGTVDKSTLIRKLEKMLDDAARDRMHGQVEITLRGGVPTMLRKSQTEILDTREGTHDHDHRQR